VFCSYGIQLFEYLNNKKIIRTQENSTPPTATSCFVVAIEEGEYKGGVARENQPCGFSLPVEI
jgi:hypothetical protein